MPPSTGSAAPVMKFASSEARNSAALATSQGVPMRLRSGTLASPLVVLSRSGDRRRDHEAIRKLVEDEEAEAVIVGLPLSLDGSVGRASEGAIAEAAEIASVVGVPVDTYDERLTTVFATMPCSLDAIPVWMVSYIGRDMLGSSPMILYRVACFVSTRCPKKPMWDFATS